MSGAAQHWTSGLRDSKQPHKVQRTRVRNVLYDADNRRKFEPDPPPTVTFANPDEMDSKQRRIVARNALFGTDKGLLYDKIPAPSVVPVQVPRCSAGRLMAGEYSRYGQHPPAAPPAAASAAAASPLATTGMMLAMDWTIPDRRPQPAKPHAGMMTKASGIDRSMSWKHHRPSPASTRKPREWILEGMGARDPRLEAAKIARDKALLEAVARGKNKPRIDHQSYVRPPGVKAFMEEQRRRQNEIGQKLREEAAVVAQANKRRQLEQIHIREAKRLGKRSESVAEAEERGRRHQAMLLAQRKKRQAKEMSSAKFKRQNAEVYAKQHQREVEKARLEEERHMAHLREMEVRAKALQEAEMARRVAAKQKMAQELKAQMRESTREARFAAKVATIRKSEKDEADRAYDNGVYMRFLEVMREAYRHADTTDMGWVCADALEKGLNDMRAECAFDEIEEMAVKHIINQLREDDDGRIYVYEFEKILQSRDFAARFVGGSFNKRLANPIVDGHPWETEVDMYHVNSRRPDRGRNPIVEGETEMERHLTRKPPPDTSGDGPSWFYCRDDNKARMKEWVPPSVQLQQHLEMNPHRPAYLSRSAAELDPIKKGHPWEKRAEDGGMVKYAGFDTAISEDVPDWFFNKDTTVMKRYQYGAVDTEKDRRNRHAVVYKHPGWHNLRETDFSFAEDVLHQQGEANKFRHLRNDSVKHRHLRQQARRIANYRQ